MLELNQRQWEPITEDNIKIVQIDSIIKKLSGPLFKITEITVADDIYLTALEGGKSKVSKEKILNENWFILL